MKAVKKTGLVPVRIGRNVVGVPPSDAIRMLGAGEAQLEPIPEDIETIDVLGKPAPAEIDFEPEVINDLVEIRSDWRDIHPLKRIKLAQLIIGAEKLPEVDGKKPGEVAISIIEEELARRAGPIPDAPAPAADIADPVPADAPAEGEQAEEPAAEATTETPTAA